MKTDEIAKFIHLVDSRVPHDPLSVKDEGLFTKLPNGDDLETGTMLNPSTGHEMSYEEIWRTLPVTTDKMTLLESSGDRDKTFLGRIGRWFQGIGVTDFDREVHAVRGEFIDGGWRTVFCVGVSGRAEYFEEKDEWKVGNEIEVNGRKWKVLCRT